MATRLLAGGFLLLSALIAWLTINVTIAARVLQAGIGLSVVYVGYLAWQGGRSMRVALRAAASGAAEPTGDARSLPFVSLVVPARDEAAVIADVIADLAGLRYNGAGGVVRFEVLVVDDRSTDDTAKVARAAAGPHPHVRVVTRADDGPATKGAALAFAHPYLRGDVIGVVDADTRLEPDFLERAMRAWHRDPGAAALQVRRRPRNEADGWLTAAQGEEQAMDLASQCGRWATDGTAELRGNGMFVRRESLERAGGWSPTALTEDLDLSTRLAVAGERVTLAPEARVDEEAVEALGALWSQRLRWAEGSLRRLMEHGPAVLTGRLPLGRKADFAAFTGEFLLPPLFVTTILASVITIPLPRPADWTVPASLFIGYGLGTFLLALAGLAAFGRGGAGLIWSAARGALFLSHWMVVVPMALARIALLRGPSGWAKTSRSRPAGR